VTRQKAETAPTAAELAAGVARTRARLSRSLAKLDREYALRHLVVRAGRMMRDIEGAGPRLRDALHHDVVPLVFIGIGLGWLSFSGRGGEAVLARVAVTLARLQSLAIELVFLPRRSAAAAPDTADPMVGPPST
jgi:hypothetical protein